MVVNVVVLLESSHDLAGLSETTEIGSSHCLGMLSVGGLQ